MKGKREMTDVTTIQAQPEQDSAQQWRTALERAVAHPNFGRQIIRSQFAEKSMSLCLNSESWTITDDFEEIIQAEIAIPLPQLRADIAWTYAQILCEDQETNSGIFARCWNGSPVCQDCAAELRKALEEDINFFRQSIGEMHTLDESIA
jgi:hypothetical protein